MQSNLTVVGDFYAQYEHNPQRLKQQYKDLFDEEFVVKKTGIGMSGQDITGIDIPSTKE